MSDDPRPVSPDTASVSLGHEADDHLGSLKPPIYETSTFVFKTAEEGKRFFEVALGLDEAREGEEFGYIYSRLDNPNLRVAEARLAVWEGADDALVFNSGMAAINTVFLTYLRPGDLILYSIPAYGGTAKILESLFTELGVTTRTFRSDADERDLGELIGDAPLAMVYVETPANPTNEIFDIALAGRVAHAHGARLVVDNTFLSPVWQRPLDHDADLVVHSATKYLGGHSDITAGAVCGGAEDIDELRHLRYRLGTTASPATAWMLTRSLETLRIRVEKQTENAIRIAAFLNDHSKVSSVNHLSLLETDEHRKRIYESQCLGPGAMISFEVVGGEEEAFRFLNAMKVVHLAVSLGGTESLASHPWTMSQATMAPETKRLIGVTPGLIRFSVGVEDSEDLIHDLEQALSHV
ncbi:MAG: aminotransferase class I/II-fold pyridoxal phosphate-dependent enzyme [Acidobacteria bacterium]|nr:aminotransferase class I/II-fold pyridoxal phosphate-dependent enzyme [Acidobacteriota bacterium]TDI56144.1 MAG: aminotransferase class I/II-fold pyridoxal phosphate-dependent enzyme [Acidobacteriota bacterium]